MLNNRYPSRVVLLSRDLFFGMRIRATVQHLGCQLTICSSEAELHHADANLYLVDFNGPVDWDHLRNICASTTPVIAFGSHTNVEGFRLARAAGVTRTISNGMFSRTLPQLLTTYLTASNSISLDDETERT